MSTCLKSCREIVDRRLTIFRVERSRLEYNIRLGSIQPFVNARFCFEVRVGTREQAGNVTTIIVTAPPHASRRDACNDPLDSMTAAEFCRLRRQQTCER